MKDERQVSTITTEQLLRNGWKETTEPVFPIEKQLGESNLYMVVHMFYNEPVFALRLPQGELLNIDVGNIDDLNTFEGAITSFEYPY